MKCLRTRILRLRDTLKRRFLEVCPNDEPKNTHTDREQDDPERDMVIERIVRVCLRCPSLTCGES